ncbi:MAG: winged helix-turn-helix domain-containing protein [Euryarchaeota archaeon]|nr:winged helix-turn-helix domain-containing protein [Euryarchaeota archaeon]
MITPTEEYGQYAGKIWEILNAMGPLSETNLLKTTKLDEKTFHAAVGWLAKENKICRNGTIYKLGESNLTPKIGADAGKVWKTLDAWGEVDVSNITKLTQIDEKEAYSALGWLARENKIDIKKTKLKDRQVKFRLK